MTEFGQVIDRVNADGSVSILQADPVVAFSFDLLAGADPRYMRVTSEGHLSLGADGRVLYRPVRFSREGFGSEVPRFLVCERVER